VSDEHLQDTLSELKKFNAKRKWKVWQCYWPPLDNSQGANGHTFSPQQHAILATMAINKLTAVTTKLQVLQMNSSYKQLPAIPEMQ
jgi:hypothetical protein